MHSNTDWNRELAKYADDIVEIIMQGSSELPTPEMDIRFVQTMIESNFTDEEQKSAFDVWVKVMSKSQPRPPISQEEVRCLCDAFRKIVNTYKSSKYVQ